MSGTDVGFERLLAEYNQAYADSEMFNNWMPPDGEYIVSVSKTANGIMTDSSEKSIPWWRITGMIQEPANPDLDGKEFPVGFYTGRAFGILKSAASVLSGKIIDTLKDASDVVLGSAGMLLKVRVETKYSKKHKQNFSNCSILQPIKLESPTA